MGKRSETLDIQRARRLGVVLRKLREEQGITAARLANASGLSRSYLTYLESGKFAEVGLDKFSRLIDALGLGADEVLQKAGYLPLTHQSLPEPRAYLGRRYKLSGKALDHALAFLDFLQTRGVKQSRRKS